MRVWTRREVCPRLGVQSIMLRPQRTLSKSKNPPRERDVERRSKKRIIGRFMKLCHALQPLRLAERRSRHPLWYLPVASLSLALAVAITMGAGSSPPMVWAQEDLFIADYAKSTVTVYARTAQGDTDPLRTLAGPATGLSGPFGLVVDQTHNELIVANFGNNSITVY